MDIDGFEMFMSTFYQTMDVKGRMSFPNKLRELIGQKFVITKGYMGRCLFVYTSDSFKALTSRLAALPTNEGLRVMRYFLASACEVEADKQGRILVPQPLREYGELQKDIVVAGVNDHIEIWDRKNWDDYTNSVADDQIAASMGSNNGGKA